MASAAVTTLTDTQLQVTYTSSGANWDITSDLPGFSVSGIRAKSIQFDPSGSGDTCVIRNKSAAGAILMKVKCSGDGDQRVKYLGGNNGKKIFPYIVLAQQVYSSAGSVVITFDLV